MTRDKLIVVGIALLLAAIGLNTYLNLHYGGRVNSLTLENKTKLIAEHSARLVTVKERCDLTAILAAKSFKHHPHEPAEYLPYRAKLHSCMVQLYKLEHPTKGSHARTAPRKAHQKQ